MTNGQSSVLVNRLRLLAPDLAQLPEKDRDSRLKSEIRALIRDKEGAERKQALEALSAAFPYWPPDIKPPPPPNDQEMINALALVARQSDEQRRRIIAMLRSAGLNTGLTDQQGADLRRVFMLPPTAQPELNRVLELTICLADTMVKIDDLGRRLFDELGQAGDLTNTPRILDPMQRLLPLSDSDQARFTRKATIDQVRAAVRRRIATVRLSLTKFQKTMATKFAPQNIESSVQGNWGREKKIWEEYIRRWNGRDNVVVEAQVKQMMAQAIDDAAREINNELEPQGTA